jgi:gluconolactonase
MSLRIFSSSLAVLALISTGNASPTTVNNTIVSIPSAYLYKLPPTSGFFSDVPTGYVYTNFTSDPTLSNLFASAKNAPFVSYRDEFLEILGHDPKLVLVDETTDPKNLFAYEAGVWVYDRNEVWFTSSVQVGGPSEVRVLKMDTYEVYQANVSSGLINANGGYYFDGLIYFTTYQSPEYPGGIVSVDPNTGEVNTIVNSYFGLRLNSPDDLTWVVRGGKKYMFFTDLDYAVSITQRILILIPFGWWLTDAACGCIVSCLP